MKTCFNNVSNQKHYSTNMDILTPVFWSSGNSQRSLTAIDLQTNLCWSPLNPNNSMMSQSKSRHQSGLSHLGFYYCLIIRESHGKSCIMHSMATSWLTNTGCMLFHKWKRCAGIQTCPRRQWHKKEKVSEDSQKALHHSGHRLLSFGGYLKKQFPTKGGDKEDVKKPEWLAL